MKIDLRNGTDDSIISIISLLLAVLSIYLTFLLPLPFNYLTFWSFPLFGAIFIIYLLRSVDAE